MSVPGQRKEVLGFAPCVTSPGGDFSVASPQCAGRRRPILPRCCEGGGGHCESPGGGQGLPCALLLSGFLPVRFLQGAEGFELLKLAQSNPELAPAQRGCVAQVNTNVGAWAVASSSPLQDPLPLGWERFISSGIL